MLPRYSWQWVRWFAKVVLGRRLVQALNWDVSDFMNIVVDPFVYHCCTALITLKVQNIDHIVENLRRLCTFSLFDPSWLEHYNVHIRTFYHWTSISIKQEGRRPLRVLYYGQQVTIWAGNIHRQSIAQQDGGRRFHTVIGSFLNAILSGEWETDDPRYSMGYGWDYIMNSNKAGLLSQLLASFKENAMNTLHV